MRTFRSPDGTVWQVQVQAPGASNAMVMFHHPDGRTSRGDRYAWHLWRGAEAQDVTARLNVGKVLEALSDGDIARLFRRSMPVSAARGMVGRAV